MTWVPPPVQLSEETLARQYTRYEGCSMAWLWETFQDKIEPIEDEL